MRPPRHTPLIFHNHQALLTTHPPSKLASHHHIRPYSSSSPAPSLIKTHNIPAPHLGHIRILSLNSPRNRNAISRQLLSDLTSEINTVQAEAEAETQRRERGEGPAITGVNTRVLILTSEIDECFSAGADLKERVGMTDHETKHFLHTLRAALTNLSTLPLPTISAVSSVALGGGLELALATTFRVFHARARVGLPETRLGIIPGAGGTVRLRGLVGERRAMEMVLTGRRVGGVEAGVMGICERVVGDGGRVVGDDGVGGVGVGGGSAAWVGGKEWKREAREKVFERAVGMAREICEGGPGAVGAAMRAVREGTAEGERREYEGVLGSGDRDEALRAFGEKREAVFKGT